MSNLLQSLLALATKIGAGVGNYLLFVVIAQYTGTKEFGIFSISFSVAMLFGVLGSFGQQVFLVKQVLKEQVDNNKQTELGCYYFSAAICLFFSLLACCIFVYWAYFWGNNIDPLQFIGGGLLCFAFAVSQTTIGALRVQEHTILAIFTRDVLWRFFSILGIIFMAYSAMNSMSELTSGTVLFIIAVTLIPIIFVQLLYIVTYIRKNFKGVKPQYKFSTWFDTSSGMALVAFIASSDLYVYTIVLENLLSVEEVGAFFASFKTVELLNTFLMTVTLVVAPQLSKLISQKNYVELQKKCNSAVILQSIPVLIGAVIILIAAPYCLLFFHKDYMVYSDLLRVLTLGMLFNVLTGPTVLMMQLGGMHWRQVVYQGSGLLISLALLPPLISAFGVIGAALSYTISKVIWNVSAIHAIIKKFNVDPSFLALFTRNPEGLKSVLQEFVPFLKKIRKK